MAKQTPGNEKLSRLYVGPFATGVGAEKLREDVIAELRKINKLQIAASASAADATLDGGGEIWVKGYRSLNPRSGRFPSDGTPVHGGYLSVELKDLNGQTFWSYLATPGTGTANVSKELAKRIARHVAEAMEQGEPPTPTVPLSRPSTILKAAGATFPEPVYAKWFRNYRRVNPNLEITYDATGSEAGIRSLLTGSIDFGASDGPGAIRELVAGQQDKYLLFPSVVGAVVPIFNLPGVSGDIAFSPEALAGIYLGKIKKWDDPALKITNKGVRLPDLDIVVVHRADGSGTSYTWTDYLSKTNADWQAQVGCSMSPKWPVGRGAAGNEGVAKLVKEIGGSIGYVEYIYALQNHLSFGKVRNRQNEFVEASLESMLVAVTESVELNDDLGGSIVNAPGTAAYPIATFTWFVVPSHITDNDKRVAIREFLGWMLGPGQLQAAALGYLALPKAVVSKEQAAIARID